jgi:hypothetical protein
MMASSNNSNNIKHHCEYCLEVSSKHYFRRVNELYSHQREQHFDIVDQFWLACPQCHVTYPSLKVVKAHKFNCKLRISEVCKFCSKTFVNPASLSTHERIQHSEELKTFWKQCIGCSEYFPNKRALNRHNVNCYTKPSVSCLLCSDKFPIAKDMYIHARTKHSEQVNKTWSQCLDCLKYFPDETVMNNHKKSKEGCPIQLIRCSFCTGMYPNR